MQRTQVQSPARELTSFMAYGPAKNKTKQNNKMKKKILKKKKSTWKAYNTVWFQLSDILEKTKL